MWRKENQIAEHFAEVLNWEEPEKPVGEKEVEEALDEIRWNELSLPEIKKAIRSKNGNVPGMDGVMAEILKADTEFTTKIVKRLLDEIWENEILPKD